jgi:hypothetical protein
VIAVRAIDNVGRKTIGGQLGRNEDMVQPGTIVMGRVGEGKIMSIGASQGAVEQRSEGRGEGQPAIRVVGRRGPVLGQVRAAVPIPGDEGNLVEEYGIEIVKEFVTSTTVGRGVHVHDGKSAATNGYVGLHDTAAS